MRTILILTFIAALAGCTLCPEKQTIVDPVVVKITIPDDFMDIPPYGPTLDLSTATQKDVAAWIADTEGRMQELEKRLQKIRDYNKSQK